MVSLRLVYEALNFKKIVPIIKNQAVNLQTIEGMKSQRAYQILVVLVLILPASIFAQQQMPLSAQKIPHTLRAPSNFNGNKIHTGIPQPGSLAPFPLSIAHINGGFAIQSLPFFCKKEYLFEKHTSVPLRVRLGSLEYVNKLEGKENHCLVVPGN